MYNNSNNTLSFINRTHSLFNNDIKKYDKELKKIIEKSSFLVIGGAGSIGQAVVKELFKRSPKKLHTVDINENNTAELIRDIRSSLGYMKGEFKTFILDVNSLEYDAFIKNDGYYDFVLNLSALKHVRNEKDPFTLMRMCQVNILNTEKTLLHSIKNNTKKYFCVSTDKAINPVNMMGASKKIMELFLMKRSLQVPISTARFANVAFSDGSLLHSFNQRLQKNQAIVAPYDIKRYFITPQESGELCLMSCIFGNNRDIFFPKLNEKLHLLSFKNIAIKYLQSLGFEPYECQDEREARLIVNDITKLQADKKYPCLFTKTDTTGEKDYEEFYTNKEQLNIDKFEQIGVIKNNEMFNDKALIQFIDTISMFRKNLFWSKEDIINAFYTVLPDFNHQENNKYLDDKM